MTFELKRLFLRPETDHGGRLFLQIVEFRRFLIRKAVFLIQVWSNSTDKDVNQIEKLEFLNTADFLSIK
jgi:hypothetical protein